MCYCCVGVCDGEVVRLRQNCESKPATNFFTVHVDTLRKENKKCRKRMRVCAKTEKRKNIIPQACQACLYLQDKTSRG